MYGQSLPTGGQLGRSFICKLMVQNRVLREVPPCVTDKGHMSLHTFAVMPLFRKTQIEGPFEGSTLQNARCKPSCLNPKDRRPNRISDPRPCPHRASETAKPISADLWWSRCILASAITLLASRSTAVSAQRVVADVTAVSGTTLTAHCNAGTWSVM